MLFVKIYEYNLLRGNGYLACFLYFLNFYQYGHFLQCITVMDISCSVP